MTRELLQNAAGAPLVVDRLSMVQAAGGWPGGSSCDLIPGDKSPQRGICMTTTRTFWESRLREDPLFWAY